MDKMEMITPGMVVDGVVSSMMLNTDPVISPAVSSMNAEPVMFNALRSNRSLLSSPVFRSLITKCNIPAPDITSTRLSTPNPNKDKASSLIP